MPLPILAGVKRFRPDTLIVLASRPHPKHLPRFEQWLWPMLARTILRHMPIGLRRSAAAMTRAMATEADRLERLKRINWCRVTPNGAEVPMEPWTTDLRALRRAADEAKVFMRDALDGEARAADLRGAPTGAGDLEVRRLGLSPLARRMAFTSVSRAPMAYQPASARVSRSSRWARGLPAIRLASRVRR